MSKAIIPQERIESKILIIRGNRMMIDHDLAELFGVKTKVLNQSVKRNIGRFPEDFMIELSREETNEVVTNCDRFKSLKHSSVSPKAFTEHGLLMLANILNSPKAIAASIQIVRAFVRMREMILSNDELSGKIKSLEKKYDVQFQIVFDAIKTFINPVRPKRKPIGFKPKGGK